MLQIKFEAPPGNDLSTRNFAQGQAVRIGVHTSSSVANFGILGGGRTVTIQVTGLSPAVYQSVTTDPLGDAWADIHMPTQNGQATVKVHVDYGVGSDDGEVPVFIGEQAAASAAASDPVTTDTQSDWPVIDAIDNTVKGLGNALPQAVQVATWGAVAVGLVLLYLYLKPKGRIA